KRRITIELPDGSLKEATAYETSPYDIALQISKGLAEATLVAKVTYTEADAGSSGSTVVAADCEEEEDECCAGSGTQQKAILWDLRRPLEGNCKLQLLSFESDEAKHVFWHSSAHILGQAMEEEMGVQLTVGPALTNGFYYDAYMGEQTLSEEDYEAFEKQAALISKENQPFQRLVCTREEALELFKDNPFKQQLISSKIPPGGLTTVYRCGRLVDLCRGPHLPSTGKVKAFRVTKHSAAYWLGQQQHDSLQRVYGVAFPTTKQMKEHLLLLEEAKKRDHRTVGNALRLFFFDTNVSAGSCFWLPEGAKVYNKLCDFMRQEYRVRGFQEVISPNIFSCDLWKTSGHYQNYKENMYLFEVEGREWGLKPMNCPGHCIMFKHINPSYRQLPLRLADFGVLHRNEVSGSLSGLTRVRRFQQDDAHIFCRLDQVKDEVREALSFLFYVYEQFGFTFELFLSTRPTKKALGSVEMWKTAEDALQQALEETGRPWQLNPGDGAFYGPKIDIQLWDALKRSHQCGTIQLDFQLPLRFDLQYRTQDEAIAADAKGDAEHTGHSQHAGKRQQKKQQSQKHEGSACPAEAALMNGSCTGSYDAAAAGQCNSDKREVVDEEKSRGSQRAEGAASQEQSPLTGQAGESSTDDAESQHPLRPGMARPVIIHRAILGSIERMCAVLIEHTGGKLPFWLSPRQCVVLPVTDRVLDYAQRLKDTLSAFGYEAGLDASSSTLNKRIREAQLSQWNYLLVVGEKEKADSTVTVRDRAAPDAQEVLTIEQLLRKFEALGVPSSKKKLTVRSEAIMRG
ncbi:UNVERIFIED_CONTAM: hypothetical protein H355_016802, partial [Colinus virginianus]